jgi:O-methyltransferase
VPAQSRPSFAVTVVKSLLPRPVRAALRALADLVPGSAKHRRDRWMKEYYTTFAIRERERIFLSIARFGHINRPMSGYYFEFGCHEANTMRMAFVHFRYLFDFEYVAFDSFEGLPELDPIDKQDIWQKGKLKTAEDEFRRLVMGAGMPGDKLRTVKGFFDDSLTPALQAQLLPRKAAVIYVDCDLYKSTIPVLEFCVPFLQRGTILVFDDWNCFHGDPDRGERRAFREFCERHPDQRFEEFVSTNEAKAFICLGGIN